MRKLVSNPHQIHNTVHTHSYWLGAFTRQECDLICATYDQKNLYDGVTGLNNELDYSYRKSQITLETKNDSNLWIFDRLFDIGQKTNEEFFQYDLLGFEFFQYTVYNNAEYYNYHIDTMFNGYDVNKDTNLCRKLSVSILLNDAKEFEGGELDICIGNPDSALSNKLGKGDAIFFPSYLLHRIRPVTSGIRKSLVVWILGPKWK